MSVMQIPLLLLSGFLTSVFFGMVIIPRILVISHKKRLYDIPDSRKVHTTPVPRLGGLSFFPVILMSMALVMGFRLYLWSSDVSSLSLGMLHEYLFLFVGMTLLYLVGVCDDLVGVGYRYKFVVQVVSALLLVLSGNGEKVRCLISKMMIMASNVLVFDDPTNHLDMESITALNNGLMKFSGVAIFTSHDHQFIQTTANRIMEIVPSGQLIDKVTTYDEYLENDDMARRRQGFADSNTDDED